MNFIDIMQTYFRGEKLEAALFIAPAGLLLMAVAVGAWRTEQGGFMWGTAVPALVFGLILLGTGVGVAGRTAQQVAGIEQNFAQDPAAMVAEELPRMKKVMVLFSRTLPAFGIFALLGLILRFGLRSDWALGLGSVLIAAGGIGLLIDGFAERRAHPYIDVLESMAREHSVGEQVDPENRTGAVSE